MQPVSTTFTAELNAFPSQVRSDIGKIAVNGGSMNAALVRRVCETLDIDIGGLMLRLVPLAASYGVVPISRYFVGAVARSSRVDDHGYSQLYLGANMEFPQRALCYSLHAEQAAAANAVAHREPGIASMAVSAPPCGHCRQFLYELSTSRPVEILFPDGDERNYRSMEIGQLLPGAFGPADLGQQGDMMATGHSPHPLQLSPAEEDGLVLEALTAARFAYAPYTGNYAGCALQLRDGSIFSGSYAENVAHNPGLSPLHAALSNMRMALGGDAMHGLPSQLVRCVLVESASSISQRELASSLLSSIGIEIPLEYFRTV